MAYGDYYSCDLCSEKAIYDADWYDRLEPDRFGGDIRIICRKCAETHRVIVVHCDDASYDQTTNDKNYGHYNKK